LSNVYYKNLIQKVIEASHSNTWEDAVQEWEIADCEEDDDCCSSCICGKEGIRYLYTIRNIETGCHLYPIGSFCIKKFNREDLDDEIAVREKMFKLFHAMQNHEDIELPPPYFSRKMLKILYERDVFPDTKYNRYDGYNDYLFLLDMFNKKNKDDITSKQYRKIDTIIDRCIKPYLFQVLGKSESIAKSSTILLPKPPQHNSISPIAEPKLDISA